MVPDMQVLQHMTHMVYYTILGTLLMFGGYKLFDFMTPAINFPKELVENKNVAVGLMVLGILLGIAGIIIAVIVS